MIKINSMADFSKSISEWIVDIKNNPASHEDLTKAREISDFMMSVFHACFKFSGESWGTVYKNYLAGKLVVFDNLLGNWNLKKLADVIDHDDGRQDDEYLTE